MNVLRRACVLLAVSVVTTLGALGQDAPIKHRVQPGDTVARLSWQYKIRSDAIRALNGLTGDTLTPGTQVVEVRSLSTAQDSDPVVITVKPNGN